MPRGQGAEWKRLEERAARAKTQARFALVRSGLEQCVLLWVLAASGPCFSPTDAQPMIQLLIRSIHLQQSLGWVKTTPFLHARAF